MTAYERTCVSVSTGLASLLDPCQSEREDEVGEAQRMRHRPFTNRFEKNAAQLAPKFRVLLHNGKKSGP